MRIEELEHWRERAFRFVLFLTLAFGAAPLLLWSLLKVDQGRLHVALPIWGVYVVFVGLGLAKRIPWRLRAWVFLAGLFAAGVVPTAEYGFRGQGTLLMLATSVAGTVLLGTRAGVILLTLSIVVVTSFAALFISGTLEGQPVHPITSLSTWLSFAGTLTFLGVSLVGTVGVLMRRLEQGVVTTQAQVEVLQHEVKVVDAERAATTRELGERVRAEELVAHRDRVLEAASFAAERLLASRSWQDVAGEIVENLGAATGVERVTLAEIITRPDGEEILAVRHFKAFEGGDHWAEKAELREIPIAQTGIERFVDRLTRGEAVLVQANRLPKAAAALAAKLDIGTGIAVPVPLGEGLWGFIGFESSDPEYTLRAPLLELLRTAARSLGTAIARDRLDAEREQRLSEQEARLGQLSDELKAFSYTVSHDLRAPVRQVGAFADMLREASGDAIGPDGLKKLDAIDGATRRMASMIDDLLKFHAVGWLAISRVEVDLHELVEEVIDELAPGARGREVDWDLTKLPRFFADRALVKQVFLNLLDNALKYTRGSARAEIHVGHRAEQGELVLFVRDNGVGFDPAYAHRLFQVFQRLHSAHEFEGSGIGLAHVKRIAERHGGRVWAEGAVGRGATFFVALRSRASDAPPKPPVPTELLA